MTKQPKSNAFENVASKLYNISDTSFSEAKYIRKFRNGFLLSSVAIEAGLGIAKLAGADFNPALFLIGGFVLTLAGGAELERRVELHTANNIQKGAREIQDLDFLINPKWEEGIRFNTSRPEE